MEGLQHFISVTKDPQLSKINCDLFELLIFVANFYLGFSLSDEKEKKDQFG
jgi:hypothetical protein